ncbi:MAG: tRNA (adenosine(37)-N6)-dimethylallyltransferase MiaA [Dissulfurispiraceae bacterium]
MKKVIVLLGPTGVGKTAVSILLAKIRQSEIISADSMQIYKHMDIGTAKPSFEQRQTVKHHMIDVAEPWQSYSAGEYIDDVEPLIQDLHKRHKIPIIVGGTGLYIRAMTMGMFKGPSADWDLRQQLIQKEESGEVSLYDYLRQLDPVATSKIMPTDTRRIVRALEVCLKSKNTMTELQRSFTRPLPYEFIKIGLTRDRKELYQMIQERVDQMIVVGLVDEVERVLRRIERNSTLSLPQVFSNSDPLSICPLPSLQAIGYKEVAKYLYGGTSLEEAIGLIKKRSKAYAKRQITWFKKETGILWLDSSGIDDPYDIVRRVVPILERQEDLSSNI